MNVPSELIIGDTWAWTESLSSYPASTWTLTFYLVLSTGTISFAASASGDDHVVSVDAATTGGYTAGRYRWTARVTDGSTVTTVGQGWVDVIADPTTQQDARSQARITLDAINATLQGRASTDQLSITINNRSISRLSIAELRVWRTELQAEVDREEATDQAGLGRDIRVRFGRG